MKSTIRQIEIIDAEPSGLKLTLTLEKEQDILARLASDKLAPMPARFLATGQVACAADDEGSGLNDIRAMASTYRESACAAVPSAIGSIDDLPVFGDGGGFSEPIVIIPSAHRVGNKKTLFALIGAIGLLVVSSVILIIVRLSM